MSNRYAFDLYPRLNPVSGTIVGRFSELQEAEYRAEANGTGSGKIVLRGTSSDADLIDPAGMQYVRVVRIRTDVPDGGTLSGFEEKVVGGFFLENGEYIALSEHSTKLLTFGGAGTLSYLDRSTAGPATYISGSDGPFDDTWHWYFSTAGSILHRMVTEALDPDRPQAPIPGVTMSFGASLDSDSNGWPGYGTSWLFTANVGESLLSITKRLMEAGLYVWMDPDTFELSAWMANAHGRDRTGVAWGADIIRFQSPTDGTVSTGNIMSDAKRGLAARIKRSDLLVGGENNYVWVNDPAADIVWEGSYRVTDPIDGSSLTPIGEAQLAARSDAGDTVRLRILLDLTGARNENEGAYVPFEMVQLDDHVTLHTGTGQWDWNETEQKVAAITIKLREAGDWDGFVDLGSQFQSMESRQFQVLGSGCSCPRFCVDPLGDATGIDDFPEPLAQDGGRTNGTCSCAARGCHQHEHGDLSPSGGPHHNAAAVTYDPTASGLTAADVQAAIDEVAAATGALTDILNIPTAETGTAKWLAPDGAGAVEWRAAAVDPGDIASPGTATTTDIANKLNALMAAMRTAGLLA